MAGLNHSAVFDTAIGPCGLAWNGQALIQVLLPAGGEARATAALLHHLTAGAPALPPPWPAFVQQAVVAMQALLRGEAASLAGVPLAWARVGAFERRVYEATQRLGPGETSTYGDIARQLGDPAAARAVGVALGRNPWPLVVPCHRVLAAGGRLGGFSAPGGVATKERLLVIEAPLARRDADLF
ncbi:MAG: methylated-DNA--[protein]-cysteine S-methyltransferase [Rubrivivax sp.]|nr:methylated-DNA--[protein]-cysteine S-methyltransferase [Rubrivivax sp.]